MAELCLGTVQFGMDYGINNTLGKPSEQEVFEILDMAVSHGIEVFDTAAAYGNAEGLLGRYRSARRIKEEKFKVISKLRPESLENAIDVQRRVEDEVYGSLRRLQIQRLYGYLLHKAEDIYSHKAIEALSRMKRDGLIENIGISIYHISEGEAAVESGIIDFIQMPYNIFDQRGDRTGFLKKAKSKGITVFTRSAFLQGLFMMEYDKIPDCLENAKRYLYEFDDLLKGFGIDKVSALLNYPAHNPHIDYVVVGVDHAKQLQEHVERFGERLPNEFLQRIHRMFGNVEKEIIMPNLWKIPER